MGSFPAIPCIVARFAHPMLGDDSRPAAITCAALRLSSYRQCEDCRLLTHVAGLIYDRSGGAESHSCDWWIQFGDLSDDYISYPSPLPAEHATLQSASKRSPFELLDNEAFLASERSSCQTPSHQLVSSLRTASVRAGASLGFPAASLRPPLNRQALLRSRSMPARLLARKLPQLRPR